MPNSSNLFLVSHSSGQLYLYNEELPCGTSAPHYQLFKQGESYAIHTCKTKSTRNPLYRWVIGNEGVSINEFSFSPCGNYLAIVSQDGFLRVFHYDTMELVGSARSYFGGFLCVCWSPDSKYIVVGGEDDLVTVWSFHERRIVARGQGHHSWVSVVAFDSYTSTFGNISSGGTNTNNSTEWNSDNGGGSGNSGGDGNGPDKVDTCYRLGSVGQDTQLCLWDITDDILRQKPTTRTRNSFVCNSLSSNFNCTAKPTLHANSFMINATSNSAGSNSTTVAGSATAKEKEKDSSESIPSFTQRLGIGFDRKENLNHKRSLSKGASIHLSNNFSDDPMRLIGTNSCPRFDECPLMEPLVCKKIAHERLTALVFREDCFVAACQDGYVYTWARPGKMVSDGDFVTFS